jgi:uncharacterized protein (UPF0147 family)
MNREQLESRFIEILGQGGEPLDDPEIRAAVEADSGFAQQLHELRLLLGRFDETELPELDESRNVDHVARAFEEGYRQGRRSSAERSPARTWGIMWRFVPAAVAAVVVAVFGTLLWQRTATNPEMDRLRSDVHGLQQLLAVSLLGQESAAQRLRGVQWSRQVDAPAGKLIMTLAETLQRDQNVNVRLAAADAISRFADEPTVRASVFEAIEKERDPIVQIELIDVLVMIRDSQTSGVLEQLAADENRPHVVRDRASEALFELGGAK